MTPDKPDAFERAVQELRSLVHAHNGTMRILVTTVLPDDAPDSLESLRAAVRITPDGHPQIPVSNGHSNRTIWNSPGANYAFRAWHDSHHLLLGTEFDQAGELETARYEQVLASGLSRMARRVLWAETAGQLEHYVKWGSFPKYQAQYVRCYVEHGAEYALSGSAW